VSSPWAAWFEALPPFPGLLAAGVRVPDQMTHSKCWVGGLPEAAVANAWRCVDDTFRVMRLHRFPTRQLRWTYAEALLTAVRRDDGCLLTMLTETELSQDVEAAMRSWIEAFVSESKEGTGRKKSSTRTGAR
jgi:hypothetical protein